MKLVVGVVASACLVVAGPASAQMDCNIAANGRTAQCNPTAAAQHQQMMNSSMAATNAGLARSQAGGGTIGLLMAGASAMKANKLKKDVSTLVAAGQCDAAVQTALQAGNMDLAAQAKGLCTPAAPAAAAAQ